VELRAGRESGTNIARGKADRITIHKGGVLRRLGGRSGDMKADLR
jgi:hypothetical protein